MVELSELGSLHRLLTDAPSRVVGSEAAQASILSGAALGVVFLHDQTPPVLKCDNVLLWPDGLIFLAKICDFGIIISTSWRSPSTVKLIFLAATRTLR